MKQPKRRVPPQGEIRQSQIVTTFGPGAMVDLPNHSVLVGGLDHWHGDKVEVFEERLVAWLKAQQTDRIKAHDLALFEPPVASADPTAPRAGVPVFVFPTWFVAQVEKTWTAPDGRVYRTRPLVPYSRITNGKFDDEERKKRSVVPVRFVQACVRGHIDDIDWHAFVSRGGPVNRMTTLWLDEGGAGNDFSEIWVREDRTNNRRQLSDATIRGGGLLGTCSGRSPWLGPRIVNRCREQNRLLTRAASNSYFAQTVSVISIPDADAALRDAVAEVWRDHLEYAESIEDIGRERRRHRVQATLEGHRDGDVWREVQRRRSGIEGPPKSIKQAEIETLMRQSDSLGEDKPDGDFYARTWPVGPLPKAAEGKVSRLVLCHRLREVTAQVGFTRFEAGMTGVDGELDLGVQLAPLAHSASWLPAYQNRGEGIFIAFDAEAIEAWEKRPAVVARGRELLGGFEAWKETQQSSRFEFPGIAYVMLHSLSHLLVTTLALDSGYSASAIRERIYAGEGGYGILLYTGTPGAEGTLGGLVDMGKRIGRLLEKALDLGCLCSNDPVCAQHAPADRLEARFHQGAACHGCVLIAETSCERRNDLLDRALVVPTVEHADAAFFAVERP